MTEQLPLALGPVLPGAGRVERAYANALERYGAMLEPADVGLAGLALALARGVDHADARHDVRGIATVAAQLIDVGARLRLDPSARAGAGDDPLSALLAELAAPERPAQVGDTTHPH